MTVDRPRAATTDRPAAAVPRQRWRLFLRIPAAATPGELPGGTRGWADALERAGLPVVPASGGGRARAIAAAQLPLGIAGEREVVDVVLSERLPVFDVRARLAGALPPGVTLVDLCDVWLGAPAAPAALRAADYRVDAAGPPAAAIETAVGILLAAPTLPTERRRENRVSTYDLRPLILSLSVATWDDCPPGGPVGTLRVRLLHSAGAVGRPEAVLGALAGVGAPVVARAIVRERLILDGEPDAGPG